jgi:carbonic anhydrase/acetyltransferase-like protein (isoleucine patch superfamily)
VIHACKRVAPKAHQTAFLAASVHVIGDVEVGRNSFALAAEYGMTPDA